MGQSDILSSYRTICKDVKIYFVIRLIFRLQSHFGIYYRTLFFLGLKGGGGGGVGVEGGHSDIFVKLVFEVAVVQQTLTRDVTFEGFVAPSVSRVVAMPVYGPFLP